MGIKELFDEIIDDGIITREEHDAFIEEMAADGKIDEEESAIITKMFAMIKEGKIKIVDSERDALELKKKKELQEKMAKLSSEK